MLTATLIFLVIVLISGYMGFKGTDASTTEKAKIVFYISLIIFIILLLLFLFSPPAPVAQPVKNPLL